jgi:hypothetical protein
MLGKLADSIADLIIIIYYMRKFSSFQVNWISIVWCAVVW